MPDFASLESQDVREYWAHEEREFTPWLADQIRNEDAFDLEDTLGLDLEIVELEKSVGKYNVDLHYLMLDHTRPVHFFYSISSAE